MESRFIDYDPQIYKKEITEYFNSLTKKEQEELYKGGITMRHNMLFKKGGEYTVSLKFLKDKVSELRK